MTTEVLRNMIYAGSDALDDLALVVLDEVHFLQDAYRGPVWEEVIIHLPPEVQLVCLVGHGLQCRRARRVDVDSSGLTRTVTEGRRPVELLDHYLVSGSQQRSFAVDANVRRWLGEPRCASSR